jgi:iron complex outermembrane receptor protein
LRYQHPSGFFAGVNTQISSSYNIDYAGTVATDGYALLGFSLGYAQPKKGWEVHLDINNVTNEHYAAAISPVYNLAGNPNSAAAAAINPGDGFGLFGGLSYSF